MQREGLPVTGRLASALADADDCVVAVRTRLDPIVARLGTVNAWLGVSTSNIVRPSRRTDVDRTRGELDLNRIVIQVQEKEKPVIGIPANHGRSQLHFGARILSVQSWSPVVMGRLATACTQSVSPAGRNRTNAPTSRAERRPGGSSCSILVLSGH